MDYHIVLLFKQLTSDNESINQKVNIASISHYVSLKHLPSTENFHRQYGEPVMYHNKNERIKMNIEQICGHMWTTHLVTITESEIK